MCPFIGLTNTSSLMSAKYLPSYMQCHTLNMAKTILSLFTAQVANIESTNAVLHHFLHVIDPITTCIKQKFSEKVMLVF